MTEASGADTLRFTVLGPVRATRGDEALAVGSPQQRALLAALLLRGPRTATAAELVDALWGEEPPHAAVAAVRTYASRIRKALGPDAELLVSESGGYALRPTPDRPLELDVDLAESHAGDAEKAQAYGDREAARACLAAALDLWDGEVLAGVPGPYAETQRTRLEERRLVLLEARLELDLELGRHTRAVAELTALTAAHPLRESLRELLMLALYRSGRQAEALAVYADTRRLLADELGVDPRASMAQLHQRMLRADSELETVPEKDEGDQAAYRSPRQLPAAVADFTGRDHIVAELGDELAVAEGRVMAVSAVAGIGGVGKTTLAVHVAHAAAPHFPDGQLYVDLQGAGPSPAAPEVVLGAFLRALGVQDSAVPESLAERAALYRSTLAGRRVLALLDNARDAAQVRPLLPGTESCAALVTSRTRMADLEGAHLVDLDVMSLGEALTLFTRIVGTARVDLEREAATAVVAACGYLPLAIRIAASRLASRRSWTVSVLARKLADERRRLDELRVGDLAVRATFALGYGQLEPAQARAFRLLGLADGPDISLEAAAALLDVDVASAEDVLESLVDASLLEGSAPGRYRFHDLVRLFARDCAEREEDAAAEREAALSRLLDFFLATAARVYVWGRQGDRLVDHVEPLTSRGVRFDSRETALAWLFDEAHCALACAQQSADASGLRRAVDLLALLSDLVESGADAQEYERAGTALLAAGRALDDAHAQARTHMVLVRLHTLAGRLETAEEHATSAMLLGTACGDPISTSYAANGRGIIAFIRQRHDEARTYYEEALEAFGAYDNTSGQASVLCNLSRTHLNAGEVERAVELAEEGVALYARLGSQTRLANARYALGMALARAGRTDEAVQELTEALERFMATRQQFWVGMTYYRLAELTYAAGMHPRCVSYAERSLSALHDVGGDRWRASVLTVFGRALESLGQHERADVCWREALPLLESVGSAEAPEVRALLERQVKSG